MAGIIRFFSLTVALFTLFCSPGYSQSDFWHQTNGPFGGTVNSLVSKSNGDIFAGTEGSGVFRSSDNGDTWSAVNNGLTRYFFGVNVKTLAINNTGDIFAGTSRGVFRSTNNGDSWDRTNFGLTSTFTVFAIAINGDNTIFAGARSVNSGGNSVVGIFRSTDNGDSWSQVSDLYAHSFAFNSTGDIFAGTRGDVPATTAIAGPR